MPHGRYGYGPDDQVVSIEHPYQSMNIAQT